MTGTRHGTTPAQMRALRARYGLGQRAFSLLLGWGEITLHRYERGAVPDAAHDAQLRMADDPGNVRILLTVNGHKLTPRQRATLEARLAGLDPHALVAAEPRAAYATRSSSRTAPDDVDRRALLRLPLAERATILEAATRACASAYNPTIDHEWLDADLGEWDSPDA